MQHELLFILVSVLAAFLHGAFGFGFPLLSTPLLLLGFDLTVAKLALLTLPLILAALWVGIRIRKKIDMETYRGMLRAALWVISIAIMLDALRRMLLV